MQQIYLRKRSATKETARIRSVEKAVLSALHFCLELVFSHSSSSGSPGVDPFHMDMGKPVVKRDDYTSNLPLAGLFTSAQDGEQELCFIDVNFTTRRWYWTSGNGSIHLIEEIILDSICHKCFLMGSFNLGTELVNEMKFSVCIAVTARAASIEMVYRELLLLIQSSMEAKCKKVICVC